MRRPPYCVGMTGGIGSGKSLAADCFAALGAKVIDTDAISRQLTGPQGAAMAAIVRAFGPAVRRGDGGLDRMAMRTRVFADPEAKRRLEAILHPMIRSEAEAQLHAVDAAPYVILVVPLLLESGTAYLGLIDRILVVDCPEPMQVERVRARDHLALDLVQRIMASQASRSQRLAAADDVLDNGGDEAQFRQQVASLHENYLALAGDKAAVSVARPLGLQAQCGDPRRPRRQS